MKRERDTASSNPTFLKSIDVGRRLGIGADRVRQLAREGRIKAAVVLPGGQRLFATQDVEAFANTKRGDERVRRVAIILGLNEDEASEDREK